MATLHASLAANATTNINVGDVTLDHGIVISYACTRGALFQAGQITILSEVAAVDYNNDWFSDDVGLTVGADVSGNNMRLNMAVDNSSGTAITFNYNVTKITLV